MRNTSVSTVRKILLLASVLILMLTLCGCRTRITNNDEVSNVMYDEEGYRQEEYNMRRDDLGLGKAPKPVFTGLGAPEEDYGDYDYGSDSQALEDYDPEAYEEPYEEPEEETSAGTSSSGSGSAGGGSGRVIRRNSSSGNSSKKNTSEVEVVLDANGGTIGGKETITVEIEKDGDYGALPSPDERDGYVFDGWFTKKDGGTNVGSRKLASTKKHKLYAHWTKAEAQSYTITLNVNEPEKGAGATITGSDNKISVSEGEKYTLPSATCDGFDHKGWTDDDNNEYTAGAVITINKNQTFTACWDKNPLKYWTAKLDKTVASIADKDKDKNTFDGDNDNAEFLQGSGMKKGDGSYKYLIFFGKEEDAVKGDKPTIVIPEAAIKGTEEEQLIYKCKLLTKLYEGVGLDTTAAAKELKLNTDDLKDIVILSTAEESEDSGDSGDNGEE